MARAHNIYLVYSKGRGAPLLGAFTVKYEAHTWVSRSVWEFSEVELFRMRDGIIHTERRRDKPIDVLEWDLEDE